MEYSGQFTRASYGNLWQTYNDMNVLNAELAMLLSLNVSQIRIDMAFDPWLEANTIYQNTQINLVNQIRAAGAKLTIADAGAQTYFNNPLTWAEFTAAWPNRVSTLASLFEPDYHIVIKEPSWYVPMISDAKTNPLLQEVSTWTSLLNELDATVKSVSPSTLTGVSGSFGDQDKQVLAAAPTVSNCDFIGIDTYNPANNPNIVTFINGLGSITQPIWLAEAWSSTNPFNSANAESDATWIQNESTFASSIDAYALNPFYSDCFVMYTQPTVEATLLSLYETSREPAYYAYQQVASGALKSTSLKLTVTMA